MGKHNETGARGEHIAQEFLLAKGFDILHRNWRAGRREIDVVAMDGDMLVFIEIKTRGGILFGYPEEAVTARKQGYLRQAAQSFMRLHPQYPCARFDIVSILLRNGAIEEILHLPDAF